MADYEDPQDQQPTQIIPAKDGDIEVPIPYIKIFGLVRPRPPAVAASAQAIPHFCGRSSS